MKASIIVSDMDSQGMILATMQALCTQDLPRDEYEVILPDLGNFTKEDDALLRELEKEYQHFSILRGQNKNRTEMLNLGAKEAKGELLLFIESHIFVNNKWVPEYVSLFEDKSIILAQGGITTVPTDSWVGRAQNHFFTVVLGRLKKNNVAQYYFDFHNSAMRKSCFDSAGGFRNDLPNMGEFELGARICEKGITIHRVPESIGWHFNDNRLSNYSRIVGSQGQDRTRIFLIHGKEFMQKYFPTPRLVRYFSNIRRFRLPLLALIRFLLYLNMFALTITKPLRLKRAAPYFFKCFAENSVRYGMVQTANEWKKYHKERT